MDPTAGVTTAVDAVPIRAALDILAWTLHVNVAAIGFKYGQAITHGNPIVLFTPDPQGGWKVQAVHQRAPGCLSLPR